jgi:hypothetical protein
MEVERLKELFYVEHGKVYWKKNTGYKNLIGCSAGSLDNRGYRRIGLDCSYILEHVVVYAIENGFFPENKIDHKDRDRSNNAPPNLREVTNQCNARNSKNYSNNKTGIKGVSLGQQKYKYCSKIKINQKQYRLYRGDSFEEAVLHRYAAEQCLDWNGCDSSSPSHKKACEILECGGFNG